MSIELPNKKDTKQVGAAYDTARGSGIGKRQRSSASSKSVTDIQENIPSKQ